jgi:hypothetical protein
MVHLPLSMLRPNLLKISESTFAPGYGRRQEIAGRRFALDDES